MISRNVSVLIFKLWSFPRIHPGTYTFKNNLEVELYSQIFKFSEDIKLFQSTEMPNHYR